MRSKPKCACETVKTEPVINRSVNPQEILTIFQLACTKTEKTDPKYSQNCKIENPHAPLL